MYRMKCTFFPTLFGLEFASFPFFVFFCILCLSVETTLMLDWLKLVLTLPFKPISARLESHCVLCSGCSARPVVTPPGPLVTLHTGASLNLSCALDCLLSATTISFDWVQTLATGETLVLANRPDLWLEDLGFEHSGQFQCYVR